MYGNNYPRSYLNNYQNNMNQQTLYEQNISDQIDNQINQLVGMKNQLKNNSTQTNNQQPTAINQTFQLAPNGANGIKYVNSIEDVNKETVFFDTPFFSKDLTVLWIKNHSGEIKAYELNEIVQKDEKDLQIELLKSQIDELKGMIENERVNSNVDKPEISKDTTAISEPIGEPIKKDKSTSISRVSKRKEE